MVNTVIVINLHQHGDSVDCVLSRDPGEFVDVCGSGEFGESADSDEFGDSNEFDDLCDYMYNILVNNVNLFFLLLVNIL